MFILIFHIYSKVPKDEPGKCVCPTLRCQTEWVLGVLEQEMEWTPEVSPYWRNESPELSGKPLREAGSLPWSVKLLNGAGRVLLKVASLGFGCLGSI